MGAHVVVNELVFFLQLKYKQIIAGSGISSTGEDVRSPNSEHKIIFSRDHESLSSHTQKKDIVTATDIVYSNPPNKNVCYRSKKCR